MKVGLKPYYGKQFYKNKVFELDNGSNIFFGLKDKLNKEGIELNTVDLVNIEELDWVIYCDVPYPWEIQNWINLTSGNTRNILFTFESPIINPFSHMSFNSQYFERIYTWDDRKIDNRKYLKFFVPQIEEEVASGDHDKFLTTIISNKKANSLLKLLSPYKDELYSERREVTKYFDGKKFFDLYGYGWRNSEISNYKGIVDDKLKTLSSYKFCLAFENCRANGYITEKVFDCFKAGTVPIYYGAYNVDEFIPESAFIDFSKFKDYKKLEGYLFSLKDSEIKSMKKSGRKFILKKETMETWFSDGFIDTVLEAIEHK